VFDQTFVNTHGQTRRPWTVAASLTSQAALVAVALIVPLLHVASLPVPTKIPVWMPLEKVDLKVKPKPTTAPHSLIKRPIFRPPGLLAPTTVHRFIDLSPETPEIANRDNGTGPVGPPLGALLPGIDIQPLPVPVPVPKPQPLSAPVRVGIGVQSAKLVFGPKPVYPPLARTTRTQGTVKIQALIGRNGVIRNLQVISGPPLLIVAALGAVQQWRYEPTLLNGEPVEVITEIEVNFTLSR
jgi:periplasmic protein TonB